MAYTKDFRQMVFQTAEKLTSSDRDSLRYIYAIPEKDRDCSSLDILKALQKQGCYSNAEELATVLKSVHREDLAREVEYHKPSPLLVSGSDQTLHNTPTQLRGKCDANIVQTHSIASELKKVRDTVPNSGLSQEALDTLCHELVEVEKSLQLLLGRCEVMHRCCSTGLSAPPPSKPRPIPRTRHRVVRGGSLDDHSSLRRPLLPPSVSHTQPSSPQSAPKFPAPFPPNSLSTSLDYDEPDAPTVSFTPDYDEPFVTTTPAVEYDEPDVHTVNFAELVQYYASKDLIGDNRHLQSGQLLFQRVASSTSDPGIDSNKAAPPPRFAKAVWKQFKLIKLHRDSAPSTIVTSAGDSDTEVVVIESSPRKPQVPKRPDFSLVKKSRSTSNLLSPNTQSLPTEQITSQADIEDSGYCTGSGSTGNLLAEWASDSLHSAKKWPAKPKTPTKPRRKQECRHYTPLKKRDAEGCM